MLPRTGAPRTWGGGGPRTARCNSLLLFSSIEHIGTVAPFLCFLSLFLVSGIPFLADFTRDCWTIIRVSIPALNPDRQGSKEDDEDYGGLGKKKTQDGRAVLRADADEERSKPARSHDYHKHKEQWHDEAELAGEGHTRLVVDAAVILRSKNKHTTKLAC